MLVIVYSADLFFVYPIYNSVVLDAEHFTCKAMKHFFSAGIAMHVISTLFFATSSEYVMSISKERSNMYM